MITMGQNRTQATLLFRATLNRCRQKGALIDDGRFFLK